MILSRHLDNYKVMINCKLHRLLLHSKVFGSVRLLHKVRYKVNAEEKFKIYGLPYFTTDRWQK